MYFDKISTFGLLHKLMLHESFTDYITTNSGPYIQGYHGIEHALKAINTFYNIIAEDHWLQYRCIVEALIWHDSGYIDPNNDYTNTDEAIRRVQQYNNSPMSNKDKVIEYIKILRYPYDDTYNSDDIEVRILRDCDQSMILYDDHIETLFSKLLDVERGAAVTGFTFDKVQDFIDGVTQ